MSEPKKRPRSDAELDGLLLEIQRLEVDILIATSNLERMNANLHELRHERDEMRGGQSLFMLEENDE